TPPSYSYTLSLPDALPILLTEHVHAREELCLLLGVHAGREARALGEGVRRQRAAVAIGAPGLDVDAALPARARLHRLRERYLQRSEEHTSELQSRENLVCR